MDVGNMVPALDFVNVDGTPGSLADFRGRPLVLYFYPKDDTPGCTNEAKAFSDLIPAFDAIDVRVLGASRDTPEAHRKFILKHQLKVALASDVAGHLTDAMGVWVEKSMYGKTYMGIERSTFLLDTDGRVIHAWRKVKVAQHAESVLNVVRALTSGGSL